LFGRGSGNNNKGLKVNYRRPMEGNGIMDGDVKFVRWDGFENIYGQRRRKRRKTGRNKLSISISGEILKEGSQATKKAAFLPFHLPSPPVLSLPLPIFWVSQIKRQTPPPLLKDLP
jgi:hypothetical protein